MVAHTYSPRTWEMEAGGNRVQGQSGLHRVDWQDFLKHNTQ
jgi:hypothetical protein